MNAKARSLRSTDPRTAAALWSAIDRDLVDRPAGMPANVTRFVVQGSTNTPRLWLRLHVDGSASQPFSCENVEYRTGAVTPCPAPLAPIATAKSTVGGTVGATLSLTLGAPASFGAFVPGVAADYTASTTATVTSTAGDAALTVADPSSTHTGHLVNGEHFLPQALRAATAGGTPAEVGSTTPLRTYTGPVSNDSVAVGHKEGLAARSEAHIFAELVLEDFDADGAHKKK